jgi:hypothetical protein
MRTSIFVHLRELSEKFTECAPFHNEGQQSLFLWIIEFDIVISYRKGIWIKEEQVASETPQDEKIER